jgi:hypothetical protein
MLRASQQAPEREVDGIQPGHRNLIIPIDSILTLISFVSQSRPLSAHLELEKVNWSGSQRLETIKGLAIIVTITTHSAFTYLL